MDIDPAHLGYVATVVAAFLGGGLLKDMWATVVGRKRARLEETQALSQLSAEIRAEIRAENQDLRDRMDAVVAAVTGLTDLLDDYFPKITGLSDEERLALRHQINLAKRVT